MIRKVALGKMVIGFGLMVALCLVLSAPASAGRGGMGGGGFGGVRGGFQAGGLHGGSLQGGRMHGGRLHGGSVHGGRVHRGTGFHGAKCCINGAFFGGFVVGSVFPAPTYYYIYPQPVYPAPIYVPSPTVQSIPQLDVTPSIPREACFTGGCYRLQGDGFEVAYQWIWVPAPPPPPTVIPYPSGRYELRGPSRWEWIPNPAASPPAAPAVAPASSRTLEPAGATRSQSGLYRWTDEDGVTHWTQGLQAVPERYRPQAGPGAAAAEGGTL